MFVYDSRQDYEDRVKQLQKDYGSTGDLKKWLKTLFNRNDNKAQRK